MDKKISQEDVILNLLKQGKKVNCWTAPDYGITRLSAIIFNLRNTGYKIESIKRNGINRYGHKCYWFDYQLIEN